MVMTQINGGTQIQANTITSGQVNNSVLVAAGTNALTGNLSAGSNKITSLGTPTVGTDAANKSYVDSAVQGLSAKYSADAGTNTETLTISGGTVTQITGTTVNGVSPSVGDNIWIGNAPAATGAAGGSTLSSQPANGLYVVNNNTTNLTVARAADFSTGNPAGAYVFVAGGSQWGGGGFVVTSPSVAGGAFTWGTTAIQFTQFTGAGEITVDSTLTKTGNQIVRAAITGDVSIPSNSNTATIGAGAVTLAKLAAAVYNTTPTATTLAEWDANANLAANTFLQNSTSTATAAGTTTLTIASTQVQVFTGTTTQTVKLPTTSVPAGQTYTIVNQSTGAVTVQSSGANTIATQAANTVGIYVAQKAAPTAATDWVADVTVDGKALTVNNSLVLAGTDATTITFQGTDTYVGRATTDTLTNKTISGASNTLSNISLGSLASAAYNTTPTASTLAEWDTNKNLSANNLFNGWTTTATAAGTTTLSITSTGIQQFTGTSTQTVLLPTTSVPAGATYLIINESTGNVTVQSSGANTVTTLTSGQFGWFVANVAAPTTAAQWDSVVPGAGAGTVTSASVVSANGFGGSVANATTTPAITLTTSVTGILNGNGTAVAAATGANIIAPSAGHGLATRETPSGTINGSNVTFTLANTPVSGSEMVFQNGILLVSGAAKDYTISGGTITFVTAPATGDTLMATYWY